MLEPTNKTAAKEAAQAPTNRLDDKKNFDNSITFDSGYLSSQQINSTSDFGFSSSEIAIDEKPSVRSPTTHQLSETNQIDSGVIDDQEFNSDYHSERAIKKDDSMIVKSGINEWMCELSLKDRNDLDCPKGKTQANEPINKDEMIQRLCELCYQQDEDGET